MINGPMFGRQIRVPGSGVLLVAHPHEGDYRIEDQSGQTVGWMRGVKVGSRKAWSITTTYNGEFTGRYVDMAHAASGILSRLANGQ